MSLATRARTSGSLYLVTGALSRLEGQSGEFFLVEDGHGKWHGITKHMLRQAAAQGKGGVVVGSILHGLPLPHVHPDHALDVALSRIGDWPFIPVVNRADLTKLEGIVSLDGILKTYRDSQMLAKARLRSGG